MILYVESSAVLAWLLGEPTQRDVLATLTRAKRLVCSRLTLVEVDRTLHVAVAIGRIDATEAKTARELLARVRQQWAVLELTEQVCRRSGQRFPQEPVRTLDALHLASMLELQSLEPKIQPLTLDQRVRENALLLGFQPLP
ncbi:MAG: type II toxin-antitoxin system VapC family toxin [Proteobacteria bacterium]|nr:type II toxin-antitoxin system VapC family toxin [Pseudomonadota bacterium]